MTFRLKLALGWKNLSIEWNRNWPTVSSRALLLALGLRPAPLRNDRVHSGSFFGRLNRRKFELIAWLAGLARADTASLPYTPIFG